MNGKAQVFLFLVGIVTERKGTIMDNKEFARLVQSGVQPVVEFSKAIEAWDPPEDGQGVAGDCQPGVHRLWRLLFGEGK